jgi:hypothetical protein
MSDHDPPLLLEADLGGQRDTTWFKHVLITNNKHQNVEKLNNSLAVLTG